jgi:hypothetical protein
LQLFFWRFYCPSKSESRLSIDIPAFVEKRGIPLQAASNDEAICTYLAVI